MGGRGASSASSGGRSASGAKTFDDLRTYMQDHYGIAVDHSIDKLDFETVKQGIAGVDDVLKHEHNSLCFCASSLRCEWS